MKSSLKYLLLAAFWVTTGCSLYTPLRPQIKPMLGEKPVRVAASWSLITRPGNKFFEGARPQEMGGMTVSGDTLFFGNLGGKFYAVDRLKGRILWSVNFKAGIESRPLVTDKTIYLGCNDGSIYALSIHGGRILWKQDLQSELVDQPTEWNGMLFTHTSNGRIIAMDASTGKWMWEVKRPEIKDKSIRGASRPVVVDQKVYVGTIDGALLVLNVHDGTKVWDRSITPATRFSDVDTTPIVIGESVIVSAYDGSTYSLSRKDGSVLWTYKEGAAFDSVLVGQTLFISTQTSTVDAVDALSGKKLWSAPFDHRDGIAAGVSVDGPIVAFGTTSGAVFAVSKDDGHFLWTFNPGAGVTTSPVLMDNSLYVLSNYGNLYAFSIR